MPLTTEQKQTLKSTAPIFKENGKEITSIMYKHMFTNHPELLNIFNRTNQRMGTQPLALANTIYLVIENVEHLDALSPQILLIAHKHRASTVLPEHYPIVGKYLLIAINEFLGGMGDQDILSAWSAAYNMLATIFINIEKKLYAELGDRSEHGFIPFNIIQKERISDGPVFSFTLERKDGKKLHEYHPGQYITLRIKKDGFYYIRHYSLLQPSNGKSYQIAIKQEIEHEPKGIVSNEVIENYHEGDTITLSLPAGTYGLANDATQHLFIAGGIGVTVLSALVHQLAKQGQADSATLIHCVPSEDNATFASQMRSILSKKRYHIVVPNNDTLQTTIKKALTPETHVYLCGSVPFMDKIESILVQWGHSISKIHMEAFQPSLSLIKNAVKH